MGQQHELQEGTFHITTNARGRVPWLTLPGVPELIILNLHWTKILYEAKVYAFCVLPNHFHMVIRIPEGRSMSRFVQSFKSNSARDIGEYLKNLPSGEPGLAACRTLFTSWQKGFHTHYLEQSFYNALNYVHYNAFRHHLVEDPLDWPWSSLVRTEILDGFEC